MASRWQRYNEEAALVQTMTEAAGVILVVIDGRNGHGVQCIMDPRRRREAARILRLLAVDLEDDIQRR